MTVNPKLVTSIKIEKIKDGFHPLATLDNKIDFPSTTPASTYRVVEPMWYYNIGSPKLWGRLY